MRLLECSDGKFKLTKDLVHDIPRYAVLSHTWGPDTEEVSFRDLVDGTGEDKTGYNKIRFCAVQAKHDGLQYFWVDTCCIDKSNSNELSTAINSMFRWYQNAARCYVYLSGISATSYENGQQPRLALESAFRAHRWFTRGWTLQELLAPESVEFFTQDGRRLGDKRSLEQQIHEVTGIAVQALRERDLSQFGIDERFKWAETRLTTQEEDWAYCLLGIFGIFMPLIYGEGKVHAVRRLRKEIDDAMSYDDVNRQGDQARDSAAGQPSSTETQTRGPVGPSFYNYGGDQINAPGGTISKSDGPGNHFSGAKFFGTVSFTPPKDRKVDEAILRDFEKAACLRSLVSRNIDARQHDIAAAYRGTCDWLFSTDQFQKWCNRADLPAHNGVLWIKGKPGSGKSTLMKHTLRYCEEAFGDHLIVAHFFDPRGEVLEKTSLGLLRSIVYQLLDKDDTLYERFRPVYEKWSIFKEGEWAWPRAQLEDFIRLIINKRYSKLLLLIDALDECDERGVRDIVRFLESLSINAVQTGVILRICLSSRHYRNISMEKTLQLTVEARKEEHGKDIPSAAGYASCGAPVMGKWSTFTRRRMRWDKFPPFDVQFKVPVMFVAPPTNLRGPMGLDIHADLDEDRKIHYVDGSADSINNTYTFTQAEFDEYGFGQDRGSLRTADNEMATWLHLLMALQRMESESRQWQQDIFFSGDMFDMFLVPPRHTLAVGIQRKTNSLDNMPAGLKKPCAITTLGHLVEIAAMLGIHWKEFDRSAQQFRAQGNGFSLRGRYIDNLGVVFTFHKVGPSWFKNHRIVPNDSVKELCFGFAPTIFRPPHDKTFLYTDEARDKKTLQLGSLAEIAKTLVVFGCNITTVNYFGRIGSTSRHGHIFPIAFEMLGMLGAVFHIKDSAFRMLPNPTIFPWDRKSFSIRHLLCRYTSALREDDSQTNTTWMSQTLLAVADNAKRVEERFNQDDQRKDTQQQEAGYSRKTVEALHEALTECTDHLKTENALPLVESVFRVHLEAVLGILNDAGGGGGDNDNAGDSMRSVRGGSGVTSAPVPRSPPGGRRESTVRMPTAAGGTPWMLPTLVDLDSASPEERCIMLADLYVKSVRTEVVNRVDSQLPDIEKETINEIWCLLVFRMLFWLLLHDFHRKDVQLPKSDLFGSRVPVYIA